jgi:hypothetical protein
MKFKKVQKSQGDYLGELESFLKEEAFTLDFEK